MLRFYAEIMKTVRKQIQMFMDHTELSDTFFQSF